MNAPAFVCRKTKKNAGFTLIELSIVLVIIGLLVGGVLVGNDLIKAAEIRSQVSQIEKYNTAVNAFKLKYNNLSGDIPDASAFGFIARGTNAGQGDGNGLVQGIYANAANSSCGSFIISGESVLFWADLSSANFIEAGLNAASATSMTDLTAADIPLYLPKAKISGNYVAVGSGQCTANPNVVPNTGANYFVISAITGDAGGRHATANLGLSVYQAYSIDTKIDDGLPQAGKVTAQYWNNLPATGEVFYWAGTNIWSTATYATAVSPTGGTTCFDNGNIAGTQKYSIGTNGGSGMNCNLAIRFQ